MKNLIRIFMIFTLVMATGFSAMSYAMASFDVVKIEKIETLGHGDCHKQINTGQTKKNIQNHGKCCDKGMCKCIGSNCHGISNIFSNGSNLISIPSKGSQVFAFNNLFIGSALPSRLKRPPKDYL